MVVVVVPVCTLARLHAVACSRQLRHPHCLDLHTTNNNTPGHSIISFKKYPQARHNTPTMPLPQHAHRVSPGLFHTLWPASGPMFPKLRLKLKPNLISLAGGMAALPCTDPTMRATPLTPAEWRQKMAAATAVNGAVEQGREEPVGGGCGVGGVRLLGCG